MDYLLSWEGIRRLKVYGLADSQVGYGYDYASLNHNSSGFTRRNIKLYTEKMKIAQLSC